MSIPGTILVSASEHDSSYARRLEADLREAGFREVIRHGAAVRDEAIAESMAAIMVLSPAALRDATFQALVSRTRGQLEDDRQLVVIAEPCPPDLVPPFLRALTTFDVPREGYAAVLARLVPAVAARATLVAASARPALGEAHTVRMERWEAAPAAVESPVRPRPNVGRAPAPRRASPLLAIPVVVILLALFALVMNMALAAGARKSQVGASTSGVLATHTAAPAATATSAPAATATSAPTAMPVPAPTLAWQYKETGSGSYDQLVGPSDVYIVDETTQANGNIQTVITALDRVSGAVRWSGVYGALFQPPVLSGDTLFFGDDSGLQTALNADTGATLWSTSVPSAARNEIAVGGNTYYVLGDASTYPQPANIQVAAFDATTGAALWTHQANFTLTEDHLMFATSDRLYVEEAVYSATPGGSGVTTGVNTAGTSILALNAADGKVLWETATGGADTNPYALVNTTLVTGGGAILGYNTDTGQVIWQQAVANYGVFAVNNQIYTITKTCDILAVNPQSGQTQKISTIAGGKCAYFSVDARGILYLGGTQGLVAIALATGATLWTYRPQVPAGAPYSPNNAIATSDFIYYSYGENLLALRP